MGPFGVAHGMGGGGVGGGVGRPSLFKIFHTHPTLIKLGTATLYLSLRKIQKVFESRSTPLDFRWYQHFFTRNWKILLYQEIQLWISFHT